MTRLPITDSSEPAPARLAPEQMRRMEELGRVIAAYNEVTDKLQASHDQLTRTVQSLRQELGEKNRLLERKSRLAALGEMAAGMAHEIRNPLGGIQLYASLLARDVADRPDALQRVNKITGGVKRLESLVGQALQFTREITALAVPVDLATVVDQAVEYASQAIAARGIVHEVQGPRPMPALADPGLLGQAVLNLLLNAAEAIGENGAGAGYDAHAQVGFLSAAKASGREEKSQNRPYRILVTYGVPPAGSAARQFHLTVEDTGPGVPPAVMDRIFNPFFTTKDTGTGLGLSIVHRIVEAHDGTIHVTNPPAGGAKFEIRI